MKKKLCLACLICFYLIINSAFAEDFNDSEIYKKLQDGIMSSYDMAAKITPISANQLTRQIVLDIATINFERAETLQSIAEELEKVGPIEVINAKSDLVVLHFKALSRTSARTRDDIKKLELVMSFENKDLYNATKLLRDYVGILHEMSASRVDKLNAVFIKQR